MVDMTTPRSLTVINFWAGPGAGKSTQAAGLFRYMKRRDYRVELVTEVAKDWTYERATSSLDNQLLVLAQQDQRLRRLVGKVDFAITDSPLLLSTVYAKPEYEFIAGTALAAHNRYTNWDVWVSRTKPYAQYGRTQTEQEAIDLDAKIRHRIPDVCVGVDSDTAPSIILSHLLRRYKDAAL